jgi:hypothetical protein
MKIDAAIMLMDFGVEFHASFLQIKVSIGTPSLGDVSEEAQ